MQFYRSSGLGQSHGRKVMAAVEAHMNIRREVSMHLGRRNHKE